MDIHDGMNGYERALMSFLSFYITMFIFFLSFSGDGHTLNCFKYQLKCRIDRHATLMRYKWNL